MDFVEQRPLFEREYRTHYYGIVSDVFSKIIVDFLFIAIQCSIITFMCFWLLGLVFNLDGGILL